MKPIQETVSLIDTTCPVGDTDPSKRYKVQTSANNSTKHDRCDLLACPVKQEVCDQPACPAKQERCDQTTCSAHQSSPRQQIPKLRLTSWKILPTEKSLVAGTEGINRTNKNSPQSSRSPRPPLVSDIVSKNRQETSRSGTSRDSPGRSESKYHKRIVPGLSLKDTSPSGTGPDSERSTTKDSRRLPKLKKADIIKRSVVSKQTTKHKQQTYEHESVTEDEYKSQAEIDNRRPGDSPRLSAKRGGDNSSRLSAKSGPDGTPRASAKSGPDGSSRRGPTDSAHLSAKSDRYKKSSDSKRSSAGSSTRSSPRSRTSQKPPSLAKSSKIRGKKTKSKRKKESLSSSPEVDDEPYIRVDISPRQQTTDGKDISSSLHNTTLACLNPECPINDPCLNPECPKKSPRRLSCTVKDTDMRETSLRETAVIGSPRLSRCPCFRSFSPGSGQTSPRHSRDSPRVSLAVKPRSKLPCYNPECPKKSPHSSLRADEDVDPNNENTHPKLSCYSPDCPKKSPRKSPHTDEGVGPSNEIPRSNLSCYNSECPKKSPRRPSRANEDVGTSKEIPCSKLSCYNSECPKKSPRRQSRAGEDVGNENPRSKLPCCNPECLKKSPRKSSCVDENACASDDAGRCKPPCLARGPVIPVYDRPPCMAYMVPPGVKDTLKDIVNKITIFGLSSGTPEVGRYPMKKLLASKVYAERVLHVKFIFTNIGTKI